ncbi:MAG: biotin synthase BioB [Dehalococcoidia bacterium]|nr:biotin synthase BioB [Dehalococcoidia bacterium]
MLSNYSQLAEKSLSGEALSREECLAVLDSPDEQIMELLSAAFKVRATHFGKKVSLHLLINAKSGLCPEDCSYCSQSSVSTAEIQKYPLLDDEQIIQGAREARQAKAIRYCIVSSGRSTGPKELNRLCRQVKNIKKEMNLSICTSLGLLTPEAAIALKQAGVDRYNHNLNASQRFYSQICTSHTYRDRLQTLQNARAAGMELCCGAIFGMGETDDDIIDLSLALRELKPHSIPVNFLIPIEGTPVASSLENHLNPLRCLKILCLLRFLNPELEIRVAGGREYHLRSLQPLALYPANSIFVAGYLTTSGQTPPDAWQMIQDMGFEIEQVPVSEVPI